MMSPEYVSVVPQKSFFKLDEVCTITAVKPYVLRYWENEFDEIAPVTSSSGQKLYSQKDIETILEVKVLMFEKKLTIERAKMEMKAGAHNTKVDPTAIPAVVVREEMTLAPAALMNDSQKQKLILAKAKLISLISSCEEFKRTQNW